jgi:hypothetical protein
MCKGYLELNQFERSLNVLGLLFLLFNILDHICTTCLFLQIFLENLFKFLLQIVKGIRVRLQEAFFKFEISPLFQMFFL